MIIFTVVSTKGGVGKTTATANLGALLADLGMRVLLVDADVQPSLSRYFPLAARAPYGLTEMIKRGSLAPDCISTLNLPTVPRRNSGLNPDGVLDIVLSDAPEGQLQDWLSSRIDRAVRIKSALSTTAVREKYDVVLVDTQGAVGHLQDAAVLAADTLISPVSPDILSAREFTNGMLELLERLEPSSAFGITVPPMRAVIYKLEHNADSRAISEAIREQFLSMRGRVNVLKTIVPHAVAYKRSATDQTPVHWLDPRRAGKTMHQLVWELIPSLENCWASLCGPEDADDNGADDNGSGQ